MLRTGEPIKLSISQSLRVQQLARRPEFAYWAVVIGACIAWPYSGLSVFQLCFFLALSFIISYNFSRRHIPLMVYFVVMLFYWILIPAIQIVVGVNYIASTYAIPSFGFTALIFTIVHVSGILAGSEISLSKRRFERTNIIATDISVTGAIVCIVVFTVLVIYLGPAAFFLSRVEQSSTANITSFVSVLARTAKLIPVMLMIYIVSTRRYVASYFARRSLFAIVIVLLVVACNPINTARYTALSGYLMMVLFYLLRKRKIGILKWAIISFPAYGVLLLAVTSLMRDGLDASMTGIFASLGTLEFSPYTIFISGLNTNNFPYSNYVISHILIFVPRSIWEGKAQSLGVYVATRAGYTFTNVGINSFFEAFADFGFMGLFAMSVIFGAVCRKLNPLFYDASFRSRGFMYGIMVTALSPILFRGDLGTMMTGLYSSAVAYEVVRFTSRLTFKRQRA